MNLHHLKPIAVGITPLVLCLIGCESTPETYPGPEGVLYRETEEIERVWVAEGFDFSGYDVIWVTECQAEVAAGDAEDAEKLNAALRRVQTDLAHAIQMKQIVATVITNQADLKPESKCLKLQTSMIDFDAGSAGLRIFYGIYGAGNADVQVRGRMSDLPTDKPLLLIEDESSSDRWGALSAGDAVLKMVQEWVDFMSKVRNHESIEYED